MSGDDDTADDAAEYAALEELWSFVFEEAGVKVQRAWTRWLAGAIDHAGGDCWDRWALVVSPPYLNLNVGMVRCLHVGPAGFVLLLEQDQSLIGLRWIGKVDQYKNAPKCQEAEFDLADMLAMPASVTHAFLRAIDSCGKAHKGNRSRWNAHSSGGLRFLQDAVGRSLPKPEFVIDRSRDDARAAYELAELHRIDSRADLAITEKEALRKYRCGQGLFRDRVAKLEKRCCVTHVEDLNLLVASHIKPWSQSNNQEKLDGNNGLFLAPHIDRLFDQYLISFENDGTMITCPASEAALLAWGVRLPLNVGPFRPGQCRYLNEHREEMQKKAGVG